MKPTALIALTVFAVVLLVATTAGASRAPEPSARAARTCKASNFVVYALGGVSCRQARYRVRWMRRNRRAYPRYRCSSGSDYRTGASCVRGRRSFGFHPPD